jgi:hypothetical protein
VGVKAKSNGGRLPQDAELRAIGLLVTATSNLEGLLGQLIRDIAGLDEAVGQIFTDPMQFSAKLRTLRELLKERLPKAEHEEASRVLASISELIQHRNTVTHGDWFSVGGLGAEAVRLKRGATDVSNVKAADLLTIAERIEKAHFDLTMYVFRRLDVLVAGPKSKKVRDALLEAQRAIRQDK